MILLRRALIPMLVLLAVMGVLFYGVFPTRSYLDLRSSTSNVQSELDTLTEENERLRDRLQALHTPEEIERLARREYNLVYPGEEAYAILPAPPEPIRVPDSWPLNVLVHTLAGE